MALTKNLYKNFGAGLQTSGRRLEWCAHKLPHVAENLLVYRGANLQLEEAYLARIHDLASEVYVMTAVLSRASRSLTLGLDSHEMEGLMAVNMSFESKYLFLLLSIKITPILPQAASEAAVRGDGGLTPGREQQGRAARARGGLH